MSYLVFDIGCIECGEESQPVGVFDTKEAAEQAAKQYFTDEPNQFGTKWGRKEWGGQHSVEIFELAPTNTTEDGESK